VENLARTFDSPSIGVGAFSGCGRKYRRGLKLATCTECQSCTKYLRSGFRSVVDKSSHVSFQFGQVFVTDIHHVTRFVIL